MGNDVLDVSTWTEKQILYYLINNTCLCINILCLDKNLIDKGPYCPIHDIKYSIKNKELFTKCFVIAKKMYIEKYGLLGMLDTLGF
jgi:hypothetical protein